MTANTCIHITELLSKYEDALVEIGYSYTTRLLFLKQADLIIRRHEAKGLEYIAVSVIEEYIYVKSTSDTLKENFRKGTMTGL